MSLFGADCPGCSTRLRVPLQIELEKTCVLCPKCGSQFFAVAPVAADPIGIGSFDFAQDLPPKSPLGQYPTASFNPSPSGTNFGKERSNRSWVGLIAAGVAVLVAGIIGIVIFANTLGVKGISQPIGQSNMRDRPDSNAPDFSSLRKSVDLAKDAQDKARKMHEQAMSSMEENLKANRSAGKTSFEPSSTSPSRLPNNPNDLSDLNNMGFPSGPRFGPPQELGGRPSMGPAPHPGPGFPFGDANSPPGAGPGIAGPGFQMPDSSLEDFEKPTGVRVFVTNASLLEVKPVVEKLLKDLNIQGYKWSSSGENLSIGLTYSGALSDIEEHVKKWGEITEANTAQRLIRIRANKP